VCANFIDAFFCADKAHRRLLWEAMDALRELRSLINIQRV
jgi:hypothetical protein